MIPNISYIHHKKKTNVNTSSVNISFTNPPKLMPAALKRSPSFQTLRESIKRSSAKLVQKLTGTSDYPLQTAVNITNKLNDKITPYEFKYSSKTESLKARMPISIMSKQQDRAYTRVNSNENLEQNDDEEEENSNSSSTSSSEELNKNDFTMNKNSKYQR